MPQIWSEIHQELVLVCAKEHISLNPPTPLILNGWMFSSDREKLFRWKETIEWAEKNGLSNLIPNLTDSQSFFGNPNNTFNYGDDFVAELDDEE